MTVTETKDRLWNSNFIKVMAANFLLFFAFYLLMPLLPLYLNDTFGSTKDVIGAVLSGYTVAALIARPFSGYLVDTFPRRQVLLVCFFLFFIFFAGYLVAGTLLLFGIVRTLHGAPFGALTVANSTVAIDVLPSSRRTEGIGYYGLSNNLAMATGPTVAIYLFDWLGSYEVLFWAALLIAGIGLGVDATVKLKPRQLVHGKRALSLDRFFLVVGLWLFINMVGFGYSYGVLSTYLAIYAKQTMGVTSGTGTFFLILAAGLMLSRLQGASALRKGRVVHNASMGMCISIVGYTLFVAMPNLWGFYGAAVLIGLGNGHLWPAFQNMMINLASNDQRGTANSTILVAWDVGIGLGVIIGGVVAEHMGYSSAFWSGVAVNALAIVSYFGLSRKHYYAHRLR
ncbi:MAG: MFS transporter [Muribaculaceae bacterium]|nr:MFS transporter [Muribaculaceae bacterium]